MEEKLNLKHSTRIIGFGYFASKIFKQYISRIYQQYGKSVDADVILFNTWSDRREETVYEVVEGNYFEIKLHLAIGTDLFKEEDAYLALIEKYDLFASAIAGAKNVVFLSALPSMEGYMLSVLTKCLADTPLYANTSFAAFLPAFESREIFQEADDQRKAIECNIPYSKAFALDDIEMDENDFFNNKWNKGRKQIADEVEKYLNNADGVPLIGIDRHRIGVDGNGVTTLVCFHGCPLHCKYCMNRSCHDSTEGLPRYTPVQLLEKVKVDNLYFLASGGGICFGGGEPLLQMNFISEFKKICDKRWKITAETSLYVPRMVIYQAAKVIDEFIVDIKESDPEIYKDYTGADYTLAWNNLQLLFELVGPERILVRVPRIPGYNREEDVESTVEVLTVNGVTRIERFEYTPYDENGNVNVFADMTDDFANPDENKDVHHQLLGLPREPFSLKRFLSDVFGDEED